ncbi:S-layer homology domain-containing protein [Brachybacterium sp. J153]|uniref:S-layer homology domain-containing protein n=1 Tax=Brachybacterium sp. J153 TaxID=3116488 RepID=UPI002E7668F3|nr:S-layer homology domain-containing protein [Brachybacterium sp. J153]MEE1618227.1 S-layer homology domain-containing protein [Brachybacterium sp. J153]
MSQRSLPPASAPQSSTSALSRRGLLAAAAVAVPGASLALSAAPANADPAVTGGETRVVDVPLSEAELIEVDGAPVRDLPQQPATMVGVTWPAAADAPTVQVRGLQSDGSWTAWELLETAEDPQTGEDAPGTEAAWIGVVQALQIRVEVDGADASEHAVAHLVTTSAAPDDESVAEEAVAAAETEDSGEQSEASPKAARITTFAAPASTSAVGPGAPTITSRAAWGADESLVRGTSGAKRLKGVVLHHTAGTNNYTSSQSAQIVRGILTYHTQSLGWADIGYNVLVSKYGQIFEGRHGGLHRNIIGAHAYGFNTGSFGISVMGNYSSGTVPAAATSAVARVVGWKLLSTFHTSATSSATWTPGSGTKFPAGKTVTLPVLFAHRDVNSTECPGDSLYAKLASLRSAAQKQIDSGWKEHLWAFQGAGGEAVLGTVVEGAHTTGSYTATLLTKGLVLQSGGNAAGYATPFGPDWEQSWGRPTSGVSTNGTTFSQEFENGVAVSRSGTVSFGAARFVDVPPGTMYKEEIEELAGRGITTGWPDGTYRPLSPIQRDAMVVFLYRALGKPAFTPPTTSPFTDMPRSRMYYKEVTWGRAQGIVEGWPDRTFRPTASIERGAVAAFLYRASGSPAVRAGSPFRDVPANHQFAREITWLASTGITTGWPDGTFRPRDAIARDAMAAFMVRWMEYRGL